MRLFWMSVLLAGCVPAQPLGATTTDAGVTTDAVATTAGAVTTDAATSTGAASATGIDSSASTTVKEGSTDLPGFIPEPDDGACDVYAQDCPQGHKCAWTAGEEASFFESTTCVPLARDPLPDGAPCTYHLDPLFDGIDECGVGAMCFEAPFEPGDWDGEASCVSLCRGSYEYPYCETGSVCVGGRALWMCVPTCDPLAQDCADGLRCDFYGGATLCMWDYPDEPRVKAGAPCDYTEACELGATCFPGATAECGDSPCCTPFCDLGDANWKCPLPGQKCLAPFDAPQAGQITLGVCRTEGP